MKKESCKSLFLISKKDQNAQYLFFICNDYNDVKGKYSFDRKKIYLQIFLFFIFFKIYFFLKFFERPIKQTFEAKKKN